MPDFNLFQSQLNKKPKAGTTNREIELQNVAGSAKDQSIILDWYE